MVQNHIIILIILNSLFNNFIIVILYNFRIYLHILIQIIFYILIILNY